MNNYCVYLITFPNGKAYVGITNNVKRRIAQHKKCSKKDTKIKFYLALKKYGMENCKIEVIEKNLTKQQACQKEIDLIKEKDLINNGYNTTNGGNVSPILNPDVLEKMKQTKNSKEFKEKISKKMKFVFNNQEHRDKISASFKKLWSEKREKMMEAVLRGAETRKKNGINIDNVNASWTEERRNKISLFMKKRMSSDLEKNKSKDILNSKESIEKRNKTKRTKEWSEKQSSALKNFYKKGNFVPNCFFAICVETNELFSSKMEICKKLNTCYQTINRYFEGINPTIKGYTFNQITKDEYLKLKG